VIKITVLNEHMVVLEAYHYPLVPETVGSIIEKFLSKYKGRWVEIRIQVV
jgi:hypothetical protein